MKLSLAWIFDHIKSRRAHDYTIPELLQSLRGSPAEIDTVHDITMSWDDVAMVKVIENSATQTVVESFEWGKKIPLPARADARVGGYFLVKAEDAGYRWATLSCSCPNLFSDTLSGEWSPDSANSYKDATSCQ